MTFLHPELIAFRAARNEKYKRMLHLYSVAAKITRRKLYYADQIVQAWDALGNVQDRAQRLPECLNTTALVQMIRCGKSHVLVNGLILDDDIYLLIQVYGRRRDNKLAEEDMRRAGIDPEPIKLKKETV